MKRHNSPRNSESFFIINGKEGNVFYSEKTGKDLTAIAYYYNRKIKTERVVIIEGDKNNPSAKPIIKITIV
jgi:hypothetical protein